MKFLVIGHSLVIDANRKFWGVFARKNKSLVHMIAPKRWSSNLKKDIEFQSNPETDQDLEIYPLTVFKKGNGSFYFHSPTALYKILSSEKYDAIFLNQETWAVSTALIIFLKLFTRNRKTPLNLIVAQNLRKEKLKFIQPYERFVSRFVSTFLYCSQGVQDVLRWKGISNRCYYFPLPFDNQKYKIHSLEHKNGIRLGYLGRISSDKGIDVLLKACDILEAKGFPFHLTVGGNGPLVENLKVKKYVSYLGLIPHNEAHEFYNKIDCFILPSQSTPHWIEQFGRVIVESFAAGKPVIGSSSGSIPEVLEKINWPWIFNESSPEELAGMIMKLDSVLKTEEGKRALDASIALNQKLFSQDNVAVELYHEVSRTLLQ